jgi:hypothetical protein
MSHLKRLGRASGPVGSNPTPAAWLRETPATGRFGSASKAVALRPPKSAQVRICGAHSRETGATTDTVGVRPGKVSSLAKGDERLHVDQPFAADFDSDGWGDIGLRDANNGVFYIKQ